jgi:hypothetical protein
MLPEYWADGLQTLHGLHMHGVPNVFAVQMNQGATLAVPKASSIILTHGAVQVTLRCMVFNA